MKEEAEIQVKEEEENREVSAPDLDEEVDSITDPGKFRCGVQREVGALAPTGDSKMIIMLESTSVLNPPFNALTVLESVVTIPEF